MKTNTEKTTAEYAREALARLDAMTPEEKKTCAREIGKGFSDEVKRVNHNESAKESAGVPMDWANAFA